MIKGPRSRHWTPKRYELPGWITQNEEVPAGSHSSGMRKGSREVQNLNAMCRAVEPQRSLPLRADPLRVAVSLSQGQGAPPGHTYGNSEISKFSTLKIRQFST